MNHVGRAEMRELVIRKEISRSGEWRERKEACTGEKDVSTRVTRMIEPKG